MNKVLKWIIIAGIFLIPFTPLIISSGLLFPFIAGKGFFFRIIAEIIFFTYIILAVRDPEYRPKKSWLLNFTTAFLVVVFLADVFGINAHKSFWSNFERMEGFFMILHLWMYFVVAATMMTKKYWHYFFGTSVGVSILIAWYGLFQLAGKIDIRQGADRLDSTIGNAAYLAVYMLLNLGFAIYLYIQHKKPSLPLKKEIGWSALSVVASALAVWFVFVQISERVSITLSTHTSSLFTIGFWMLLAAAIVYFVAYGVSRLSKSKKYLWLIPFLSIIFLQFHIIFKSSTRGSIIGLILGIIVASIVYAWKAKEDVVGRRIAWGFLGLIFIMTAVFISIRKTDFVQSNTTLRRLASISLTDRSQARAYIWPIAFKGVLERPILGYGQEGFNYVFNKHYNPAMYDQEQWFDRAHNVFLDWLIAAGIPGFALYIGLYVLVLLYIWKGDYTIKEKSVLIGLLAAYSFHNLTVFDNIPSYILFFSLLGFLHTNKATEHIKKIHIQVDVRDLIVIPLCIIIGIAMLYYVNIKGIHAGQTLIEAMRQQPQGYAYNIELFKKAAEYNTVGAQEVREMMISNAESVIRSDQADMAAKQAAFDMARKAIDAQIAYAPEDARAYILPATFFSRIGQYELALPLLEKGRALSPLKQSPLLETASIYLNQKQYDKAIETAKQTLDLAPSFTGAQVMYMIAFSYGGKKQELNSFVETSYNPDSIDDRLINSFLVNRDYPNVMKVFGKVMAVQPKNTQVRKALATVYFLMGDTAAAIETINKAIIDIPDFKKEGEEIIAGLRAGKRPIQ